MMVLEPILSNLQRNTHRFSFVCFSSAFSNLQNGDGRKKEDAIIHKRCLNPRYSILSSKKGYICFLFLCCNFSRYYIIFSATSRHPLLNHFPAFFFQFNFNIPKPSLFEMIVEGLQLWSPTDSASQSFRCFQIVRNFNIWTIYNI